MGIAGSAFVLGLTSLRSAVDSSYKPSPTYQPVLGTGLGWLLFMSGSSNIRYNLINFLEDVSYERCTQIPTMSTTPSGMLSSSRCLYSGLKKYRGGVQHQELGGLAW